MYEIKYPHLFSPIKIGNTVFKNRIFAAPNGIQDLTTDRAPTPEVVAFFERKARGGAAAVTIGECVVDSKTGLAHIYQLQLDNPIAHPRISSYGKSIARHGAVASIELQHCGMYSHYVYEQGGRLFGPSEKFVPDEHKINNDGHEVKKSEDGMRHIYEMTEAEILAVAESFGNAAGFVKRCGLGMVMIHGGHGWLLSQFMSQYWNKRTDKWGGSLENRMRFPLAVVESVRKAVGPGFPIEFRMSGSECKSGGYDIDEGVGIAKMLDGKVDLIHVSAGDHESPESNMITHPSMFMPDGVNVKYAAEIKKCVKTPVATVGALTDPAMMEEIIASGKADVISLGRQSLADPDLPIKARMGRDEEINKCLRCCVCYNSGVHYRQRSCAINPEIGFELELQFEIPPAYKKTVLVVGGGVAGMQAALTANRRGHDVILCEKSDSLGGALKCEKDVPFKVRLDEYLKRQAMLLQRSSVEIRLNTEVTPELARELVPDVVIAAIGARPVKPRIPGIDGDNVMEAADAYVNIEKVGKKVVILGGGLVGTELGIYLAQKGREITIVEMEPELNNGGNIVHANGIAAEIKRLGIRLKLSTRAKEINAAGVVCENALGEMNLTAETVIYAIGQRSLFDEANALAYCAPEFHQIGDCVVPKNIRSATEAAFTIARDIGRY